MRKIREILSLRFLWTEYMAGRPGGYQYSWHCELYRESQQKTADPLTSGCR